MKKMRKLIDVDEGVLKTLEKEAKKQQRSLKSFMEYTLEERASKLMSPSAEYKNMMDEMLVRIEKGNLSFSPIDEIKKKYEL